MLFLESMTMIAWKSSIMPMEPNPTIQSLTRNNHEPAYITPISLDLFPPYQVRRLGAQSEQLSNSKVEAKNVKFYPF